MKQNVRRDGGGGDGTQNNKTPGGKKSNWTNTCTPPFYTPPLNFPRIYTNTQQQIVKLIIKTHNQPHQNIITHIVHDHNSHKSNDKAR